MHAQHPTRTRPLRLVHYLVCLTRGTHAALGGKLSAAGNDQAAWPCEDASRRAGRTYAVAQGVTTRDIQPASDSALVVAGVAVWGGGAASNGEVPWCVPAIQWDVKRPAGAANTAAESGKLSKLQSEESALAF
jgi:hypothetical protein